ncbi:MAG: tetratricopeptide repeat protein [Terriglobales bacterium]|jgi:tetratricopeptide (TPR) repeat protein
MKRTATIFGMLAWAGFALGQQATTPQSQPSSQPNAAQTAAPQAAPAGKRPPQAKTQPEFDAYKATVAASADPVAFAKAADDFAAKFPDSELRILLFKAAMHSFQNANNADQMSAAADKVLKIDPDDPEALVGAAEVIAERTRDTDLDKDQRWAEAQKYASHAVETIETDVAIPAGTPQEKIDAYKGFMRSSAYSVLGTISFNQEKYPDAENYFRKSVDALPAQPDPVVVLRLAIALDKQNKYPEALKEANHAVELTQEASVAGKLARQERDRLVQLTGGSTPAPASKPPAGAAQNPSSH